jgi:hypothetical protein
MNKSKNLTEVMATVTILLMIENSVDDELGQQAHGSVVCFHTALMPVLCMHPVTSPCVLDESVVPHQTETDSEWFLIPN